MTPTCYFRRVAAVAVLSTVALISVACGEVARTGRAPVLLVIDSLLGASGGTSSPEFGSILQSDVQTMVETTVNGQTVNVASFFNDPGQVSFRAVLKNPGTTAAPLTPTALNDITMTRYRVAYRRSDGRNTQGTDIPYSFDGAFAVTVPASGAASTTFDLVRHQAKREPPLSNMIGGGGGGVLSAIAEVTFYGRDLAGNEVMAVGNIGITFADFGDRR